MSLSFECSEGWSTRVDVVCDNDSGLLRVLLGLAYSIYLDYSLKTKMEVPSSLMLREVDLKETRA